MTPFWADGFAGCEYYVPTFLEFELDHLMIPVDDSANYQCAREQLLAMDEGRT